MRIVEKVLAKSSKYLINGSYGSGINEDIQKIVNEFLEIPSKNSMETFSEVKLNEHMKMWEDILEGCKCTQLSELYTKILLVWLAKAD